MSRNLRVARRIAIGGVALIVVVFVAVLLMVRTNWFRNYVRRTIVSSVEESTGGRVEVGLFDFDERHLHATIHNFVIHGTEPANAAPFVSIPFVEIDLRLFTSLKRLYEVSYLGIDRPQVNVSIQADGKSNVPTPRLKSTSENSALETVVDLAVGKFILNNGDVTLFSVRQPLTIRGNNLHARLDYSLVKQAYDGELAIEPAYVLNGRNTPVNFKVALPVTIAKDRIDLHHATITSPLSQISVDGSLGNMHNPTISAHLQGRIAGADLANAGNIPVSPNNRKALPNLELDANATADVNTIKVAALHVGFGNSSLEASGTLKDPHGNGSLQLRTELALRELGQLAAVSGRPFGTVSINATAKLDSANRLDANGNIQAKNLSFTQGKERISNIELVSAFHADPDNLNLNGLRLNAFGGEFLGNASLADLERYKLEGRLRGFGIQPALRALGRNLPYDGNISGPIEAQGDTKAAGTKSVVANAHLLIAPGKRGIPVSGRLNAKYNGAADDVVVDDSWVALPHTRLNLSGSLSKRLNVVLTSKDLHDLLAAVPSQPPPPVALANNGEADFNGAISGALSKPRLTGHLAVARFAIDGRQFDSFAADVAASSSSAAVANAALVRNTMQARANASIALRNWSPTPRSTLEVSASLNNGDLADVMALAGQQDLAGYSGSLSASAQITGTYGNPIGAATIQASNGTIDSEPFNQIQFQVNLADQFVNLPVGYIDTPAGRVDFKAEFRHPRDSFSTGQVHAHVQSANLDLSRMTALEKSQGRSSGTVTINADVNGTLQQAKPALLVNAVNGDISAHAVRIRGINYGDLTAAAHTSGQNVAYNLTSNFAGSNIQATGTTKLVKDYPTTADLRTANLPVERVLAVADESSIAARGVLSGSAHVSGTLSAPEGEAQFALSKAVLYDEKIDEALVRVTYLAQSIDVSQLAVVSGPSRIDATAHYEHPVGSFEKGQARFTIASNHLDLARSATVQKYRAGLGGILDFNASGSANVQVSDPRVLLTAINASVSATGISAAGKQLGDLKLTANTQPGARVTFALDSNLAGATVHGSGNAELNPQYPVNAQLSFRNVTWSRLADLTGHTAAGQPMFEATTDGEVTVRGPLLDKNQLSGSLDIAKLNVITIPRSSAGKPITITNQGPIQLSLDRGVLDIRNAHLTGPKTDIQATGSASVTGDNLNLNLRANADIGVIQNFDRDIYSAGSINLATSVRGDFSRPLINGQFTLQNAAFNMASIPVGISNANGSVVFNGNSAQIKSLTADAGGGKINFSGFASFSEALRFGLRADATSVRVKVQEGVSIVADAGIRLTGTSDDSRVTGTATVDRVSYTSQSDFGSLLRRSAPPVQSAEAPSPFLSNMRLEIRVRNSPGITVQSSISEDLQADIDLRIRGTADQPGVQGRINISEGKLLFFGTTYTVDTGSIAFYNPLRIDPVLDLSLEAQAQGVDVTLRVTGPIDNMKLSYTSDPPLQFQEIVSLLAAGSTPTSDPTLLANQPNQPQQGFQQMGESAIVGQAVANPVANQLQRVFGVTQLKIDPTFTTGSDVPTARLALQQRITNHLTFTYVQAIDQPNSTVIRAEWAFSPQWSAVATRDQNGIVSLNFFYKRGFR